MRIICVDPRTDLRWLRLVQTCVSDVFHSPAWLSVLADSYNWHPRALVLVNDAEEPEAGIPFVRVVDMLGERIVILPFSDYCDPLVRERNQWRLLADCLAANSDMIALRCLHNDLPLSDGRFDVMARARWHGVDLQPDLETLWQRVDGASRRAIAKAQRDGVLVRPARSMEELRMFFCMHLQVRKYKYHLLAQSYAFFQHIWCRFIEAGAGVLLLAFYHEEVIGGTLYLHWKDTLYYKFNASVTASLQHRPNDLLLWEGIRHGKNSGFTRLDLGLSDWDEEGLIRYKRKFASEEKVISFLRFKENADQDPPEQQGRALLPQLAALLTDHAVPDVITERAGELLYRFYC
jgi:CelD/BcsL family acetyltransferase involved in cellulose biosynthesis